MHKLLLIILPLLWICFPVFAIMASNKLLFIYDESPEKIGVKLKQRTWGPSYSDAKKIFNMSRDENAKQKAREAIKLWKISFGSIYSFVLVYVLSLLIDT